MDQFGDLGHEKYVEYGLNSVKGQYFMVSMSKLYVPDKTPDKRKIASHYFTDAVFAKFGSGGNHYIIW